jgi:hypothetical protein
MAHYMTDPWAAHITILAEPVPNTRDQPTFAPYFQGPVTDVRSSDRLFI